MLLLFFTRLKRSIYGTETPEIVSREIEKLQNVWNKLGCTIESPFMSLSLLTLPVLPELRITGKGLVDVEKFKFIPLFV